MIQQNVDVSVRQGCPLIVARTASIQCQIYEKKVIFLRPVFRFYDLIIPIKLIIMFIGVVLVLDH